VVLVGNVNQINSLTDFGEKKSHSLRVMLECDLVTLKNNHTTWKTKYNNKLLKAKEKENNSQKHPERNNTFLIGGDLFR